MTSKNNNEDRTTKAYNSPKEGPLQALRILFSKIKSQIFDSDDDTEKHQCGDFLEFEGKYPPGCESPATYLIADKGGPSIAVCDEHLEEFRDRHVTETRTRKISE